MTFAAELARAEATVRRTAFVTKPAFYLLVAWLILAPRGLAAFPAEHVAGVLQDVVRWGRVLAPVLLASGIGCAFLLFGAVCRRRYALRIVREAEL